ncbi:MAG: heat shock protein 15 [Pseudomonadota bacterium]|jgi:ribosome-associated heat shock protein Hsp15
MEQEFEFETGYHATAETNTNTTMEVFAGEDTESVEEKSLQVHLDKWLWAARFYKTLALSRKAIQNGKIYYNGQRSRSSVEISVGGLLRIQHGNLDKLVVVTGLSTRRRSMKDAALLYQDISHHQDILRQVADSYQPQQTRARYPMSSGGIQHRNRHHSSEMHHEPMSYQGEQTETSWQKPKKLVRFLRKPTHRLAQQPYTMPVPEVEVELD